MSDVNDEQRKEFEKAYANEYGLAEIPKDEITPPPEAESPPPEVALEEQPPEVTPEVVSEAAQRLSERTPEAEGEGAKTPEEEQIDLEAEWEKLHPKAKQAIQIQREQEQRNAQAAIGRVAFLNSELDKLKKTLAQQPPKAETPSATAPAKPAELTTEQWNKLRKDDPELASAIQEALEERDRRVVESVKGEWGTALSPLDAKTKELETKLEILTLDAQVPYWREATQSNEWKEWVGTRLHPEEREALFKSEKASDVLPYVKAFNEEYTAYLRAMQQGANTAATPASTELADKVAQDRAKKLQQPTAGPASPPRTKPEPVLDPNDPVAMRKLFEQNLAKEYANS